MSTEKNPFDDLGDHQEKEQRNETNSLGKGHLTEQEKEDIKRWASEGLGVNEIARKLGRSSATVSRAFRSLQIAKNVALDKAENFLDGKLNALEILKKTNKKMTEVLEKLKADSAENAHKYGKVLALACESLRRDLELQLKVYQALYNVEEVTRFQTELMEVLGEVAPDVRERFYRRLQERRAV